MNPFPKGLERDEDMNNTRRAILAALTLCLLFPGWGFIAIEKDVSASFSGSRVVVLNGDTVWSG